MKKKISLFLFALALVAAALVNRTAEAACFKPACFASPPCCRASECADWCLTTGGGAPYCQGVTGHNGGCCACGPIES
jgi:hypothetical protein